MLHFIAAPLFKGKLQGAAKRKTISYAKWLKQRGRLVCEGRKTGIFSYFKGYCVERMTRTCSL